MLLLCLGLWTSGEAWAHQATNVSSPSWGFGRYSERFPRGPVTSVTRRDKGHRKEGLPSCAQQRWCPVHAPAVLFGPCLWWGCKDSGCHKVALGPTMRAKVPSLCVCTAEKRGSLRDPPQWEAQAPASLTGLPIHSCGHLMGMAMPRATSGLLCSDSGLSLGFAHLSVKLSSSSLPPFPRQNGPFPLSLA